MCNNWSTRGLYKKAPIEHTKRHLLYNIITLKYNINEYREIRKEDRAMQDGFAFQIHRL